MTANEQFMGGEILRRLLGLAQLPLTMGLAEKEVLLHEAAGMVMASGV